MHLKSALKVVMLQMQTDPDLDLRIQLNMFGFSKWMINLDLAI